MALLHTPASPTSVAGQASSNGCFDALDEDCKLGVVHAAEAGTLAALASSSGQLCRLSRRQIRKLQAVDQEQAAICAKALASEKFPFSSCVELDVAAETDATLGSVADIFSAAKHHPQLKQLQLNMARPLFEQQPGQRDLSVAGPQHSRAAVDQRLAGVYSALRGLQQVRSLDLTAWSISPGIADAITRMTQVTRLRLHVEVFSPDVLFSAPGLRPCSNLLELNVHNPPAMEPAAAAAADGPANLPSSLTRLFISSNESDLPRPQASWLAHLRGCPQLQDLAVICTGRVDDDVHANNLVPLLGQHNQQLRSFTWQHRWGTPGRGMSRYNNRPRATKPLPSWAAALPSLERMEVAQFHFWEQDDWLHLAALQSLTQLVGANFTCAPLLPAGTSLRLLGLVGCTIHFGGFDLGQLLLACPVLERATVKAEIAGWVRSVQPTHGQVDPHPSLKVFAISPGLWDNIAASEFAVLAPALEGVVDLCLEGWPRSAAVPDLSPCAAVAVLSIKEPPPGWLPEEFVTMVSPLVGVQRLEVVGAPQLTAGDAVVLQGALPHLKQLILS
jgi:hypothetical protein